MKQWVELEFTKARNGIFGNRSEDRLTTKDIGLDKEEETEEALILTSLGRHSESMQPSECTESWGLLTNFYASEAFSKDLAGDLLAFPEVALLHEPWWPSGRL